MKKTRHPIPWLLLVTFLLIACSATPVLTEQESTDSSLSAAEINAAAEQAASEKRVLEGEQSREIRPTGSISSEPSPAARVEETDESLAPEEPRINRRANVPADLFVNWLIPWDGIRPIYDPEFVLAAEAPLDDNELISDNYLAKLEGGTP